MKHRLVALDWMRGLVMVLMTLDHASGAYNTDRFMADSAFMYEPGTPLPMDQFLIRWITHLCAPTFLFLAGTALALSIHRQQAAGQPERAIDRHLVVRGLLIVLLDVVLISPLWGFGSGMGILFQVLYGIGMSMIAMAALRRLSTPWLLGISLGLIAGGEALIGLVIMLVDRDSLPGMLLLHGGRMSWATTAYPVLPWLAFMMLGWTFGRYLVARSSDASSHGTARGPAAHAARLLALAGAAALALFVAVRGLAGYGNLLLQRQDGSLLHWLHVSKYPPSLSFAALELGIMALVLSALLLMQQGKQGPVWRNNPILVFGQTALFFYVLHIPLLELSARALGVHKSLGLGATSLAFGCSLALLYPVCRWYRTYKAAHPHGWARYL